jgi:hypothetical protein
MKKRIVYVVHSGHDNDYVYLKGLEEGWGGKNWDITPVNFYNCSEVLEHLYVNVQENREDIAAIITMNLNLFHVKNEVRDLVLASGIPIAIWLFDHPTLGECIDKSLIEGLDLSKMWLICGEKDFIDCWQRFISPKINVYNKCARLSSRTIFQNHDESFTAFQKKEIPLLIPCSLGVNPKPLLEVLKKMPDIKKVFYAALNFLKDNPYISTHQGIEYLLGKKGLTSNKTITIFLISLVQKYIKHHRRSDVLFNLPEKTEIIFLGKDYPSKFHEKFKNATFIDYVDLEEFYNLIKRSKIIVNFECGPNTLHNRAYNAILTQTAFATHGNNFVDKMFQSGEDYIKYDLRKNDISETLQQYLDSPRKTYELTVNARKKIENMEILEDSDHVLKMMTAKQ